MTLMYENKMAGATDSRKVVYKAVEVLPQPNSPHFL
jgi:hypothetical protein